MGESLGIPFMLDAIRAALRIMARLPRCDEADSVVREALSLRETVESWRTELPGPIAREATMQRVLRLHVLAATCAAKAGKAPAEMPLAQQEAAAPAMGSDAERRTVPPPFDMVAFARASTAPESERRMPSDRATEPPAGVPDPPGSATTLKPASFPSSSVQRAAAARDEGAAGSTEERIAEMLDGVSASDHEAALDLAERILADAPANPIALVCREQCLSVLERVYKDRFGALDRVLVVVGQVQPGRLTIDHRTGFILSLIDGVTSVDAMLDLCAMPTGVALRILVALVEEGVVAFVPRRHMSR